MKAPYLIGFRKFTPGQKIGGATDGSPVFVKGSHRQQIGDVFSLWRCIKFDHCIEYGQPFSGKFANPFIVNFKYLS
jgi:hypothetical protein